MNAGGILRFLSAFGAGLVFALGLGIAGMTRPSKVIGFLDVFGSWDASLALVMGGALTVGLVSFTLVLRRASPVLASRSFLPATRGVDARLFLGSALFGIGWGLAGVCPGPALVAAVTGAQPVIFFVGAMAVGIFAADRFAPRREDQDEVEPGAVVAPSQPRSETPETTCG
jgi:uncharacterized membrane protein YedE/YeeE